MLLPEHHSPTGQLAAALSDAGERYRRYLHQDEFGPTRAERMAALRSLLDCLDLLSSRLDGLPLHLRLRLSEQLAAERNPIEAESDNVEAYRNDAEAVQQFAEAAVDAGHPLHAAPGTCDAELLDDLGGAAERTQLLLSVLDTTTAGEMVIDTGAPRLELKEGAASDLVGFAVAHARIKRLRRRAELVLARLERRMGPERCESLGLLVWELCDLWHAETGQPVTSSAVDVTHYNYSGTHHTAKPQSPAGRFVLAAVQALQPSAAWAQEPDHWMAPRRASILDKGRVGRAVYFAMREYVAHHPSSGQRGRRKLSK